MCALCFNQASEGIWINFLTFDAWITPARKETRIGGDCTNAPVPRKQSSKNYIRHLEMQKCGGFFFLHPRKAAYDEPLFRLCGRRTNVSTSLIVWMLSWSTVERLCVACCRMYVLWNVYIWFAVQVSTGDKLIFAHSKRHHGWNNTICCQFSGSEAQLEKEV